MGIFDWIKGKPKADSLDAAFKELAPQLFPGGHSQIMNGGREISRILKGKITEQQGARLYGSIKYLMYAAKDRSPERIRASIIDRGNGAFDQAESAEIYRFLLSETSPSDHRSSGAKNTVYVNADLAGKNYTLVGPHRALQIAAIEFTTLVLIAKQSGWNGGTDLFDASGTLVKRHDRPAVLSDEDAISLGTTLRLQMSKQGPARDSPKLKAIMEFLEFCFEGGFEVNS
jgi:hypothetical protein